MYANFLEQFVRPSLKANQHAYSFGKGTYTAWKSLVSKINKYKYIYEYDLKGCFDNISVDHITEYLKTLGSPMGLNYHLENINRCAVILPKEIKLDEKLMLDKISTREMLKQLKINKESDMFKV
jgi:hypothetical protein